MVKQAVMSIRKKQKKPYLTRHFQAFDKFGGV